MGPARCGDVLLVEAYEELREVLVEVLTANGFHVVAFASAREALAAAAQGVGVVLVGVNGYQREPGDDLELMQRGWSGPQVPLIALASGDGGLRMHGVARVLLKPVEEEALCGALQVCLPAASLAREDATGQPRSRLAGACHPGRPACARASSPAVLGTRVT